MELHVSLEHNVNGPNEKFTFKSYSKQFPFRLSKFHLSFANIVHESLSGVISFKDPITQLNTCTPTDKWT